MHAQLATIFPFSRIFSFLYIYNLIWIVRQVINLNKVQNQTYSIDTFILTRKKSPP